MPTEREVFLPKEAERLRRRLRYTTDLLAALEPCGLDARWARRGDPAWAGDGCRSGA